jgi:hypothetical protein
MSMDQILQLIIGDNALSLKVLLLDDRVFFVFGRFEAGRSSCLKLRSYKYKLFKILQSVIVGHTLLLKIL